MDATDAGWKSLSAAIAFGEEKLKKVSLAETPRMLFDLYCLLPGQSQKVHVHAHTDKVYVGFQGEVLVQLGSASQRITAGQAAVAVAGVPHGVTNVSSEPAVVLVFQAREPSAA